MSTRALPVRNLHCAFCKQNTPCRPRRVSHTCSRKEPIQSEFSTQPDLCPSTGPATSPRAFPDRVYLRNRARGGLVRGTARTTRALPCRPGTVPNATTAATRHLSRHSRSRCLHARHAHRRVTTPRLHSTLNLTSGDAAACSHMATVISRVYSDLTHAVLTHPTHGRSLTRASYTHTHPRGHSPAVFHTHVGVRTHVPLPARTWFLPPAVPLSHTACREARTPAHQ